MLKRKKKPPPRLPAVRRSYSSVGAAVWSAHASTSRGGPHVVRRPEASAATRATATSTGSGRKVRPTPPPQPTPRRPPALLALEQRAREVLGLKAHFSAADLRQAYRRHVKTAHPDQGGDVRRFRLVLSAYRFLSSHALAS